MSSTQSLVMDKRSPMNPGLSRSPLPRSPLPRSPMPKSPVPMEKYKTRCVHGLISFFPFRRRHSKKLISDRRSLNKCAVGNGFIRTRLGLPSNMDEKCQRNDDGVDHKTVTIGSGNLQVKKIMIEDMSIEQQQQKKKKKITTAKVEHVKSESEFLGDQMGIDRRTSRTSRRPRRLPIYGCYDIATVRHVKPTYGNLVEGTPKKLDSRSERDCSCGSGSSMRNGQLREINLQFHVNQATEAFINQKLTDAKHVSRDGSADQSKHFLDALQILNSNKDLFVKLLQDPNSLLVKHIEELRDSQAQKQQGKSFTEGKFSGGGRNSVREGEEPVCSHSSARQLSDETADPQSLEKIVVLKPSQTSSQTNADRISHDSSQIQYRFSNVRQSVKPTLFPFQQIRRKLMHAMRVHKKDQQLMPATGAVHKSTYDLHSCEKSGKAKGMETVEKNLPDLASFGKRMTSPKRKDQKDMAKRIECGAGQEAASSASASSNGDSTLSTIIHMKQKKYEISAEKRIHQWEINNGNASSPRKQKPKVHDSMTSPEYNSLPVVSPRKNSEDGIITPQMRFSPYNNFHAAREDKWRNHIKMEKSCLSPVCQDEESPLLSDNNDQLRNIPVKHLSDVKLDKSISPVDNDLSATDSMKRIETHDNRAFEEISPGVPSEPDVAQATDTNQSTNTTDTCASHEAVDCSRLDPFVENQASPSSTGYSSSSPFSIQHFKEFDRIKYGADQPSPVSVLEQFLAEDITSPSSTKSLPADSSVMPQHIGLEEESIAALIQPPVVLRTNPSISTEEYEPMLQYLSTVLHASGTSILEELSRKCHFSDQLLDKSLCDEVGVWPNQSCGDHGLLFDYINEVLVKVCQCHLRCSPWVSFIKPEIRPVTTVKSIVNEVMKCVDWNILLQQQLSQAPDQLLKKDLNKSGTWMDIRKDAEDVVSEVAESVLQELILESTTE